MCSNYPVLILSRRTAHSCLTRLNSLKNELAQILNNVSYRIISFPMQKLLISTSRYTTCGKCFHSFVRSPYTRRINTHNDGSGIV